MIDKKSYEMLRILFKAEKGLGYKEWFEKTQNIEGIKIGKDAFIARKKYLEKEEFVIRKKTKYFITIDKVYRPLIRDFYKKMREAEKNAKKINSFILDEAFREAHKIIPKLWYNSNRLSFPLVTVVSLNKGEDFLFSIMMEWIDGLIHDILWEFSQRDYDYALLLIRNITRSMFPLDRLYLQSNL